MDEDNSLSSLSEILQYSSFALSADDDVEGNDQDDDDSLPKIANSWEAGGSPSQSSFPAAAPAIVPSSNNNNNFRVTTRVRTHTEESTLAYFSRTLLSGIKKASLSKIISLGSTSPITTTAACAAMEPQEQQLGNHNKNNSPAYTMTEDNPFETASKAHDDDDDRRMEAEDDGGGDDNSTISSTTSSSTTVSSISLDSARRFQQPHVVAAGMIMVATANGVMPGLEQPPQHQHQHHGGALIDPATRTLEQRPPSEILVPSSLQHPHHTAIIEAAKDPSCWQSQWVQQGGGGGGVVPNSPAAEPSSVLPPPLLLSRNATTASTASSPPRLLLLTRGGDEQQQQQQAGFLATRQQQRQQQRTESPQSPRRTNTTSSSSFLERPGLIQSHSKSFGAVPPPVSPSFSRIHTDTTVTSVTTRNTPPLPVRRSCTTSSASGGTTTTTTAGPYDGLALLAGRPKRTTMRNASTTTPTFFSFGSRVGESSVYSASSPHLPLELPLTATTTMTSTCNATTTTTASICSRKSTTSEPLWKQVLPVVRRPPPAQLCRSRTGCLA